MEIDIFNISFRMTPLRLVTASPALPIIRYVTRAPFRRVAPREAVAVLRLWPERGYRCLQLSQPGRVECATGIVIPYWQWRASSELRFPCLPRNSFQLPTLSPALSYPRKWRRWNPSRRRPQTAAAEKPTYANRQVLGRFPRWS